MKASYILFSGFLVLCFALGGLLALYIAGPAATRTATTVATLKDNKPKIGGEFELTNHLGQRVTDKDFHGAYMLVYFGFTYCPDVCPTELQVMADALQKLGSKADRITPVFITVDPERDTVDQMATYVKHFHPRMVGLTGSGDDIERVKKVYRVYSARAESKDTSSDSDKDYLINHSSIMYLMGPTGTFLTHFSHPKDPIALAEKLAKQL